MKKSFIIISLFVMVLSCKGQNVPHIDMVEVKGGTMMLGSEDTDDNKPHRVTLDTFYMAQYPVTMKLWKQFLAETRLYFDWDRIPGYIDDRKIPFKDLFTSDECPAQGFNWYYAVRFCNWLSVKAGFRPAYKIKGKIVWDYVKEKIPEPEVEWDRSANGYRLPTEAEWEYAARGGRLSKGYRYAGSNNPEEIGLFRQQRPYPVGQFKPNELGLYDMTSNVDIWCWDWYDFKAWEWLPEYNPALDKKGDIRYYWDEYPGIPMKVIRVGNWESSPSPVFTRSTYPPAKIYWIGIRLVRSKKE